MKECSNIKKTGISTCLLMAEDMGLDRPLRLAACVLLSRRPSAGAFEPEPAGRFTEPSACASALSGPSPTHRSENRKKTHLVRQVFFLLAEDMGLEPTGLLHLT